jgi:hypothetical protein
LSRRTQFCLVVAAFTGCSTPPPPPTVLPHGLRHDHGAQLVSTRVHYGIPILQKSFFWDGNGEVDNTGLSLQYHRYVEDGVALGLGTTAASWWTGGRDVYSAELEGLLRLHPVRDWPLFLDGSCGYQLANDQIPPGGTVWNFSFSFGAGLEFPIDRGFSLLTGAHYHHISNALGRENVRNPSQNEARLWIGFAWEF